MIGIYSFMGKSTGRGALAIWTHYLTSVEWIPNYSTYGWTGTAVRVGAGVTLDQLYAAVSERNLTFIGGDCPVSTTEILMLEMLDLTRESHSLLVSREDLFKGEALDRSARYMGLWPMMCLSSMS